MKKLLFFLIFLVVNITGIKADEGMWLPQLLEQLNEKRMKSLGMKMNARDIYDINKGSLKDAIVSFGGFCTGEVISDKGLVLTNHHCGFDAVQNHSTLDKNYIRDGFWARNNGEELPNSGLFVTFIVRIEDVSKEVLTGTTLQMQENERQSIIDKNLNAYKKQIQLAAYQDGFIKPFFEGNKYYLFITETYNDVRLVGAPPSSIGNFGKDTDNWMWPRHTGDFSVFRIYAGKDNKPANYSKDNIPYIPKKSLAISIKGMEQDDFTMVFGFPGKTTEYLPSNAVQQIVAVNDPAKILVRDKALAVIDKYMRTDESIKIKYASKYAGISNAWKKWQGEVLGLKTTDGVEKKKKYEEKFLQKLKENNTVQLKYGNVLQELNNAYTSIKPYALTRDYFLEITSKIELFTIINRIKTLKNVSGTTNYSKELTTQIEKLSELFKEFSPNVDRDIFAALLPIYLEKQEAQYIAPEATQQFEQNGKDYNKWATAIYKHSIFAQEDKVLDLLKNKEDQLISALETDPAAKLIASINDLYNNEVVSKLNEIQQKINGLQRIYMQLQMDVMKDKNFYPDANSTLRIAYGKVDGYKSADGKKYDMYTYLDGVMKKYVPGDYEFDVPEKLRKLYTAKDFGKYGTNGKMPVCFIATNHTTGGNSGSPALDAYGNLVGLNFDRVWEGTMSDINYDASICRNIMVDIRYVLFIIDKYAGAGHLIKEMKLVNN